MDLSTLLGDAYKDGMTLEEVTAALKGIELPDQSSEIERLKNSLTKSNSEAAEWKRKFQGTQDEAAKKADEAVENAKKMQEELESLRRTNKISDLKATYIEMGYSKENAKAIAEALADGKTEDVLKIQKKHQEAYAEQLKKDLLKGTARPGGSDGDDGHPDEDAYVKKAQEMAKARAENAKRASEALKQYLR